MADLTWDCTCGHSNPSAAPTCAACGRVPSLAPAGPEAQGTAARSRKPLPFSAASRQSVQPPPPEADRATGDVFRPAMPGPPPDRRLPPEPDPAAPATPRAAEAGVVGETAATEPSEAPKKRPSFFDPEPDPSDVAARAAAERPKWWKTSAGRAVIAGLIVALAVLTYVIVNTGNAKAPDQTPAGSSAPLHHLRPPAADPPPIYAVVAIPPVQDANRAA